MVFELDFVDRLEENADSVWDTLSVLSKQNVRERSLDLYYEQQKLLSPKNVVKLLLGEEVLTKLRQELNYDATGRLDLATVYYAVLHVLNAEAIASVGDMAPPKKKKHHHRHLKGNNLLSEAPVGAGDQNDPQGEERPETEQSKAAA